MKSLLRRDFFSSKSHDKAWANFKRVRMHRTNGVVVVRMLIDCTNFFIGLSHADYSKKYIFAGAKQEIILNKEFTDETLWN